MKRDSAHYQKVLNSNFEKKDTEIICLIKSLSGGQVSDTSDYIQKNKVALHRYPQNHNQTRHWLKEHLAPSKRQYT